MPLTFTIDVSRRLVQLRAEPPSNAREWFDVMEAVIVDDRFRPGFDFLYDRTALGPVPDAMYVRSWVFRHVGMMKETGGGRLAVVVTEPSVFGMIRMASVHAESAGAIVDVFRTEGDALRWLGHDSESSVA